MRTQQVSPITSLDIRTAGRQNCVFEEQQAPITLPSSPHNMSLPSTATPASVTNTTTRLSMAHRMSELLVNMKVFTVEVARRNWAQGLQQASVDACRENISSQCGSMACLSIKN
jgi:hypothetical protein